MLALVNAVPWWLWALLAIAAVPAAMASGATALAALSATGTHHHQLSRRQRRLGRLAFVSAAAGVPVAAGIGLTAAWLAVRPFLG